MGAVEVRSEAGPAQRGLEPAERILRAAMRRFADYGYAKTTIAEVARDAGISVGGVYRFFPSKDAIIAASVERMLDAKLEAGRRAAAAADGPMDQLAAFLLARLRVGWRQIAEMRHLYELLQYVNERHRALLLDYERRVIDEIAAILARGAAQGRFAVSDPHQIAYDIHQATLRYNTPIALRRNPLERLEQDLRRLLRLLDLGLRPRPSDDQEEQR